MKTGVEMLACPFCGGEGELEGEMMRGRMLWRAGCNNVECRVEAVICGNDRGYVTAQWNTRHTHPAATGSVRAAVHAERAKVVATEHGIDFWALAEQPEIIAAMLDYANERVAAAAPTPDAAASGVIKSAAGKRRTFAEPSHQQAYDALRRMRPSVEEYGGMGGGGNAYAVGYTQPNTPSRIFPEGSRAYAHWAAGVDNARDDAAASEAGEVEKLLSREDLYRFMDTLKLSEKREVAKTIGFDPAYVAGERDFDRWKRMWLWAADNDKKSALATAIRAALATQGGAEG